ncbi:MAG: cytochrome-c peroxidase [Candidatus Methylomirabilales bacterium]
MGIETWIIAGALLAGANPLVPPMGLEGVVFQIPKDNPMTRKKVALGKQLFFDPRLSADRTVSCGSCHDPDRAFTDGRPTSSGVKGRKTSRNAPTLVNRALGRSFFWDGRSTSLEALILEVMELPPALGTTHEVLANKLSRIEGYRRQFKQVFGGVVTAERAAMALGTFVRTLLSGGSAFDRFEAGDKNALSPSARRGLALFRGKARCVRCHTGPNFTDEKFHNTGVGLYQPSPDLGRYRVTGRDEDKGTFKTPTLRDVAKTAPYMHDGSLATLEEVVAYYDRGGIKNPYLDPQVRPLRFSLREKRDLVAFLKSLTGKGMEVKVPALPR